MLRMMVADLDSPSYFVAIAAVELGFFKDEGVDIALERAYGAHGGVQRLRDGELHFFGGPAYAATQAFPAWKGAKLLCALAQYSYWFLAVRADLGVKRGDLGALKGLRISSSMAPPVQGLKHLLAEAGIDLERDNVRIVPAPTPSSRALPMPIGATACASPSEKNSASQSSTSIFAVVMVRPKRAGTISRR
jgi:NitT/TauT family transport system substrate-binding protein